MNNSFSLPHYTFPTDSASIQARLDAIDPIAYGKTRNSLHGKVTYLSPYISRWYLTVADIRKSVITRGYSPLQIEQFLKELAWKEYFLRVWEALWTDGLLRDIRYEQTWFSSYSVPKAFLEGKTGIEALDIWIQHLYTTGYIHNHLRMYLAGTITNLCGTHWKNPSKWLYSYLLDGDIASNTCSWQWNAGAFSSKKYVANQENINRFTGSTQRGTFLDTSYEDIFDSPIPDNLLERGLFSCDTKFPDVTSLILDPKKPTCIYTNYWLNPKWFSDIDANRVLVLSPSHYREFPVQQNVLDFTIQLAQSSIDSIQIFVGEISELVKISEESSDLPVYIIDHVLYASEKGVTRTPYPYMVPQVSGYFPSFFTYWKRVEKFVMDSENI
jgi:deoxyribodipyrimidine photo-lyase